MRLKSVPLLNLFLLIMSGFLISGCTSSTPRYDGTRPLEPGNAVIVGSITEGFLTQPHGLTATITGQQAPNARVVLNTLGNEVDQRYRGVLGNYFMYQIPAGEYEVSTWSYIHYAGSALKRERPVRFKVGAGEIAYIGDFYANALNFCLSSVDNSAETLPALRAKYPMLKEKEIINLTPQSGFSPWPSSDAKDYMGRGICNFFGKKPAP